MDGIFPLIYIFVITDRGFFFFRSLLRGKETNVGNDVCLFFSPPLLSGIPMKIVDL